MLGNSKISRIKKAARDLPIEFASVTVSDRELAGTDIDPLPEPILETGVWDEPHWNQSVYSDEKGADLLEKILAIVSNGSFPKKGARNDLTREQRHQLRDAMILQAHVREGRDILVTNDKKAFIGRNGSTRQKLERLCSTRIMSEDEFYAYCASMHSSRRFPPQVKASLSRAQ